MIGHPLEHQRDGIPDKGSMAQAVDVFAARVAECMGQRAFRCEGSAVPLAVCLQACKLLP